MILLTGASQGIGLAVAHALLARTEATLLLTGRSAERLAAARASFAGEDRDRVRILASDQASATEAAALAEAIRDGTHPVTGAIFGVGVNPMYTDGPHRLHRVPEAAIAQTLATNCTHTAWLTAAVLEQLMRQGGGTLLWIGSHASRDGLSGAAVYCASKSFLAGLSAAVGREYGDRGIRASVVHPALVRTPRTAAKIDRFAATHGLPVVEAVDVGARIATLFCDTTPLAPEVYL